MSRLPSKAQRTTTSPRRQRLQTLVVRVGTLPMAAAMALGATVPWAAAQTVITPLSGPAATQTLVTRTPDRVTVTTGTLRDGNAFNNFSTFQVGAGDRVGLVVPQGANWLVNVVRDARVQVDGLLQGQLANGTVGGNLLFIDRHGFAVGPQGRVQAGRLVFAAPSSSFVDGLLADGPGLSSARVGAVLGGAFERSDTGAVRIDGVVETTEGVQIMAGHGAGVAQAVSISGQVSVAGRLAGSAVNLGDLRALAPVVVRDGVIDITTPGDIVFNGKLLADGSHWSEAGAVRVVAGGNIELGSASVVSASAGEGSGSQGGTVSLFAHGSASNATGAALAARGDGFGSGGFIEFSAARSVQVGGLTLDAGSDQGQAGLAYIDPEDLTVTDSLYTNGANLSLEASKTLQVNTGVTLNTRRVSAEAASANGVSAAATAITNNPLTPSVGNSGNIKLTAPSIKVKAGATLDASVINPSGSAYQAGDITLTANQASTWETLISLADANASIDVAGTLTGRNLTLEASIESSASFGGTSGSIQQQAVDLLQEGLPFAASLSYVEAKGDATITLQDTAVLAATEAISLTALADRSVSVETEAAGSAKANLSAGFARVLGTTDIDVKGGASLTAGSDIALVAASKTSVTMASSAAGETDEESGAANVASIVFAGSMSDVTTSVNVAAGATLTSAGDTLLQAFHSGQYDTTAEVTVYGGGTAGVVGALSLQKSTTGVTVGGSVNAQGHVSLMAMNASAKNAISASATNASEEEESALDGLPESLEYSKDDAGAAAEAALLDSFTAMTEEFSATSDEASGGTPSESKPPALRLAGAMTWSQSNHTTRATLAAGGVISAGGDAVVDAQTLVGQLQSVALAEATSETSKNGSKISLGVAFNYADHSFTTRALVGADAAITAGHVAVNASTDVPEFYTAGLPLDLVGAPVEWGTFSAAYETLMAGTDPLYDGFNTRVGATSSATNLAAAGAVSLSFMKNDTRAWVDTGAQITSTVADGVAWGYDVREVGFESDLVEMLIPINTYSLDKDLGVLGDFVSETRDAPSGPNVEEINFSRSFDGAVVVRAENNLQTLHLAGGTGPEAGGSGGSVGGTFSMVSRDNTAVAGIADRAVVQTHRLDVAAETTDWVLSLSPTSGQGAGVAANGVASLNKLSETTRASISREALVTADAVNVNAQLSLGVIAVTGAVTKSENSGVGIGVAMNDLVGNTQAYIGDNDTDGGGADTPEGAAGFVKTSQLAVQARSDGMIVAVGVAGAAAGQESPTDKSANKNLGEKAGTKSADTQAQLDGNDSTMAPLEEASAPIKGEGTDEAAAEEPEASKPPSFSIAGAGALVTNYSDIDTTALLDGAVVQALDVGAGTTTAVGVRALSDLTQVSVAGGGALAMAKNASTTFSAAVAGAVAIQDSDDDTSALIRNNTVVSDLADRSGALVVQALKSGERTAVATGISLNLSKGSTTSLSVVGAVSATQTSDDTAAGIDGSTITGEATTPSALGVQVVAYDRSRIGAGGGALSVSTGKGSASAGAAISIVDMKGSTSAVLNAGTMTRVHDLAVAALSSQKVVGMAAVASVQTDASSKGQLMGSFVFNQIGNTVGAGVKGAATVNLTGDLAIQAGGAPTDSTLDALVGAVRSSTMIDYEMASTSNGYTDDLKNAVGGESILGVAGTLGLTLGSNAASLGLSYVHNSIQTSYDAELNGSISVGGEVSVQAISEADIVGVSVGLGATKGKFSGMGSASVNLIGQRTRALVTGGSVTASGLEVTSQTRGNQFGLAGNLSIAVGGGSGNAAGAAVSYTLSAGRDYNVGGDTSSTRSAGNEASISDATVDVGSGDVVVSAQHTSDTQSVAASGAAADGNVGFAGTLSFTDVGGVTTAVVDNTDLTAGTVSVTAGEAADGRTARSLSVAGGLALSKGHAGSLAVAWNTMSAVRRASITDSDLVVAESVAVESSAQGSIETLAVAVSAGKDNAGSGSVSSNFMISDISAEFSGGSLSGTATSLTVRSTGSSSIDSLAGAVSGGGTGAVGGALAINSVGEGADNFRVRTRLADTAFSAPVAVTVASSLAGSIESIAASGSGAGTAAINGSVTVNTIEADVLTEVTGVTQRASGGAFKLTANNDADIASLAGTVSGAGTGAAGAAVSVNKIGGNVTARLASSTLRATGALEVDASSSGTIRSVAAGASGGGTAALAGSNTTNAITSTVLAQVDSVTQAVASASLRVQALDSSTIQSFAGSVAGGGTASGGAAFALNFLGRTELNADSSKLVKAQVLNSSLNSGGAVQVKALSTSTIESMAVAVGGSGNAAVTGSNTTNLLEDDIVASWSGGSLNGSATTLTVQADDAATVRTLAGNFSGGGTAAVGAAIAVNQIGSAVGATLSDMTLGAATAVGVDADLRGQIKSVAASGAASGGASVNGSFTTNAVNASVRAQVSGLAQTASGAAFTVSADNDADIFSIAGTVSGSGSAAVGVAVAVNEVGGDVTARVASSTLRATGAVDVQATSSGAIQSVAAGMSGGGSVALAGSNTTNAITSTVLAQMDTVTQAVASASLRVQSLDSSTIQSFAGSVAGGGTAAGGAAFALNFLGRTALDADSSKLVKAQVLNSSLNSGGAVQVKALSTSTIESLGMAVGASGNAAVTGSNTTNLLEDEISATWSGGSFNGSATTLTVQADDAATVRTLAGNFSGGLTGAFGAAIAVNKVGSVVHASLSDMDLGQATAVVVDADLRGQIKSVAASGAADGVASVNGSFTTNEVNASVKAQALDLVQFTNGGTFAVSADNDADIFSIAGTVSGSGGAAVGAAVAVNDIGGDVTARLADSALRSTGAVSVQATSSSTIQSVAAGMSGGGSLALAGSNSTNGITSTVLAQVDSVDLVVSAASLTVLARDTSTIQSFAGTVAGGGAAGGGAALALNFLGRTATNAGSSKRVEAEVVDSVVRSTGPVGVNAYSTSTIESVGVAAGASGTTAITGSNSTNLLEDDITASWAGSELISTGTLTVAARQASEIDSLAGNVSGSLGASVGAAVAVNRIGTDTNASLVGMAFDQFNSGMGYWTQNADDLVLSAESDNQINTIAVGMSAGSVGVQGSVAVSVIDSLTRATLGADGFVTNVIATDSVAVTANSRDRIRGLAGAVALGAAGVGAAGGVQTNIVTSTTSAGVTGADTHVNAFALGAGLTVKDSALLSSPDLMNINAVSDSVLSGASYDTRTVRGVAVQATSIQQIGALTAVAGGGAAGAAGASINVDLIGGSTRAYIDSARFINDGSGAAAAQATDVMASNHAMVASSVTALAIGGTAGVSGSVGTETVERSTRAELIDGAIVNAEGAVSVEAVSTNTVAQISAGAAGGGVAGVAGSGDVVLIRGETVALIDSATVRANDVSVVADGANRANLIAGSIGGGGAVGVGLSFTVAVSGSTVSAVVDDSTILADGAVVVDADNRTESQSVSASGAVGGVAGVAVGATVTVMEGATLATISGTSTVGRRTLATGLVASAGDAPVTINLASTDDLVGTSNQTSVRFSLSDLGGRVNPASAVVTVTDGETTVTAVRQADGTYTANVSGLADGVLLAQVVLTENSVQKVSSTTMLKSTGINDLDDLPEAASLPAAATRISTLSSFDEVDARNHGAVRFVLKGAAGPTADSTAVVTVSDGTRSVTATLGTDGSYTADVRSLGDGVLTALVTTTAGETSRTTLTKASGAGSLSVTANEHIVLNSNAGQIGVGGVAGVGASANVVIGRSAVDASVNAESVRVSDALTVSAARDADIDMITATGGGGGFVGVSGAVGVLIFGSAPDSNANSELTGSSSTLGQINTATQSDRAQGTGTALSSSETMALNEGGRYDTQAAFSGASGNHRTSATVAAQSIVAGAVLVSSLDRTAVDNNAGAIAAGGLAGVSAGVAVTLLGGANHAGVSVGDLVVAGDVDIESCVRTPGSGKPAIESRAIAGAGGFVGVGAAVSVASNTTANTAALAGQLSAGGAVSVKALDEASLLSEAVGSTAGVLSVGVVTATATQTGSVGTTLSGQHSGQRLSASAERNASAAAQATGGSAGVYAGSGAGASASDSGTVSLTLASGTVLDAGAGDLVLSARANPSASTNAFGVSVGRTAGLGVSVAQSSVDTSVQVTALGAVTLRGADVLVTAVLGAGDSSVTSKAVAGGGGLLLGLQGAAATSRNSGLASVNLGGGATLGASGDVGISANDSMRITADATGVGVGFIGAGVAVAMAESDTSVTVSAGALGGRVAGNLTVSGRGDESVAADAVAGSGGVVAGAGADARVVHEQDVSATAFTAVAGLTVVGTTTLSADRKVRYDSQTETTNASAFGGSGAVTTATLDGSATAKLGNGSTLTGAQLRVLANNDVERTDLGAESARGGGGGVLAGAGASAITVINGTATAEIGDDVTLNLGGDTAGLLELRAYNQLRGSSVGRLDLGGAIPIALVDTQIRSNANANARLGARDAINVAGEVYINALSYVDIEANTITKTYGAAAGAQGDALALANVTNQITVGVDTNLVAEGAVTLLAGQDRDFWRNKSFVTARADLFNHAAVPVSVNPDVKATLNLNNDVTVNGDAVRSGGTIQLGGIAGSYVVEGKGKVNDWTRDVGELVGVSSEYGSSSKTLNANVALSGVIEAGFGNKQRIVINADGTLSVNEGNIRYSIGTEDLAATGAAYLDTLYAQLKNYGSIPEVRAFVEAEIAFYMESLLREGFAALETDPDTGETRIIAQENVPGTFITFQNVRAGSGNVELFGNNVTGNASITARADSEILIENNSPMNVRVKDLVIDSSGGFAKYNGTYLKASADIASFNRDTKTGLGITVDSIDTRAAAGGGVGEELPTIEVTNNYVSTGLVSNAAVIATAADGSWADLRQDQMRAPEIRVNGLVYNKLGPILLNNAAGSISVTQEDANYVPRLDGLEVQVNAGKNFVLSSPSVSQSVGGSPESIYAVAYNEDQQRKLNSMGVVACGTARAGEPNATSFNASCLKNGTGGIYASGGIFLGARYLNINGTVQSGQSDYSVTLTQASVGTTINNWEAQWTANRGSYLAQGRSSLVQVSGRRSTDNESEINKQFANGTITQSQRDSQIAAMTARRGEPVVYYDAEDNRLKVASTEVTGGLVELVGSIINTGGGVIRALDGYARFNIDNQTSYGMDLLGLDTGGDAGVVRITDLNRPVYTDGRITAYEVTTYERNALGAFRSTTTAGRGAGAAVLRSSGSTLASPSGSRLATFSYAPVTNSTYVWSAGYEFTQEKRYWYQKSSALWGAINLGSIKWNSIDIVTKDATAMPEGIYVTTSGAPSQNFTMSTQTFVTDGEEQTYYRSWKKCGPLCFKKTYYVDYRTEVGKKDVFTQRVRADHPIAIEMVGYSTGLIDVKSNAGVRLSGNITNDSGLVSIRSNNGSIEQLSGGTAVSGNDLRFYAKTGIGTEGAPVNVITGTGSFTAQSDSGNISFQSLGGALRINQVSTTGKVWLLGDEDIVGVNPNTVHVIGSRIQLSAPRGGIGVFNADGTVLSTLNIQTQDSSGGGITATAARGIALKQATGNLWVNQIASNGGDVYIEAGGDLIDNNRNETRDVRTEEELLALWDAAALQGTSAEDSRQLTLRTTRSQFRRYWALRNATVTSVDPATGAVSYTADSLNADTYEFVYSDTERAQLAQSGLSLAQINALEAARTQEVKDLDALYGATRYQLNDDLVIAEVNAANLLAGRPAVDALSTWSDAELQSPLPNAIFSKSSTDTQTRIEEPNVVGNRVVLRPGGKIGRDDGAVTIDLRKAGGLTVDDRLTIMSAETDDMSLDKTNWLLTVVKKDTFNVLSNRLNVNSNGFVYLGADTTDAYPTGGDANLEQVIGAGEVRIKVSGSILNAANTSGSVIQGHKAILEAASGSIGTALKPVTLTLTGGGTPSQATLVARAQDGVWLSQTGDMRVADVYSPASVSLTASGAIIDARGERTRSIEADGITLTALGGAVGTELNPMRVKSSLSSGVNASSALGYSIYLHGAETGLTVGNLSSGLDLDLYSAQGGLRVVGDATALGRIDAEASGTGDFTMSSGTTLRAQTGDIYVSADDVGLSQLDASRGVVVVARGSLTDTSDDAVNVNVAGRGVTLTAAGSIGTTSKAVDVLAKTGTKLVATTGGNAYLGSATSSLRIGQVSANGNAVISSGYSILDDRGTRAQAVDATNISFAAGGDVGQATGPMTVKTAADGAVLSAVAGGSVYLGSSSGVLRVRSANAGTGQLSLNGGQAGLAIGGQLTTSNGLTLSAGTQALSLEADANLVNLSGNLVLQGNTITIADGASVDGRTGSVVLSATGDITLTGIRSDNTSSGAIVVSTTTGSVLDGGDSAADMTVTSATGGIVVTAQGSVGNTDLAATAQGRSIETDAASLLVTSKTDSVSLAQTRATREVVISASRKAELLAQGSVVGTKVASLLSDVAVSSASGGVKLASITSGQDVTIDAGGKIELVSLTTPRDITLSSSGLGLAGSGQGITATSLSAGRNLSISAQGEAAHATLTSAAARAGTLGVNVGGSLTMTTATSTGALTAVVGGAASITSLASTTGAVSVTAGATLNFSTIRAVQGLTMRSVGQLTGVSATSSAGALDVASTAGGLTLTTATAVTGLTLDSAGALSATTWSSSRGAVSITSQGALSLGRGTSLGNITLRSGAEATLGTATSTGGVLDAQASGGLRYTTLSGAGVVLAAEGVLAGTLPSVSILGGAITSRSTDAANAISVQGAAGATVGALSATTGGVTLDAGTGALTTGAVTARNALSLTAATGLTAGALTSTTGNVAAQSAAGAVVLGAVTAAVGGVDVDAVGGTLTTGAITAAANLSLSSSGALRTGALTSRNGSVQVESLTGSVALTTVSARTGVTASAGSSLALTSFTVTAGGATLSAATDFSLTKGTATGAIGLTMGGQGSLGTVTSSASTLNAQSTSGGMRFTALKSFGALTLRTAGALTSGTGVGYSLFGGTLDAGTAVDVQSTSGGIQVTRLTARTASRITTGSGPLTISAVSLLPASLLVATTGSGTRTVPLGY